jgi:hypothetical protein
MEVWLEEEKGANPLGGKIWARMLPEKYSGRVSLGLPSLPGTHPAIVVSPFFLLTTTLHHI